MEKQTEKILKSVKDKVTMLSTTMESQDAAEFFNELADWAYANGEAMLIEDELELQEYEDR